MTYNISVQRQNPLSAILGIAGISIDVLINDENAKLYVRTLWKYHLELDRFLTEKIEAKQRKDYEELMREFHRNNATKFGFLNYKKEGKINTDENAQFDLTKAKVLIND